MRDGRKQLQAVPGVVQFGNQEEFLHGKGCQALEGSAQRDGRVLIPAGVQGRPGALSALGWLGLTQVGLNVLGGLFQAQ